MALHSISCFTFRLLSPFYYLQSFYICDLFFYFRLQSAKKDNDFIYHEKIPPLDSLPEIKGAPLVKGIPFDATDPEICGVDIFQKLVPMEAHEASSIYSEEKAKLLRAVMEDIETANTELE